MTADMLPNEVELRIAVSVRSTFASSSLGFWCIFGRPYYRSSHWYSVSSVICRLWSVCDVLYCGKMVRPSQKVSEGVNRKPGSKSSFLGSPPYFYFRFRHYGHPDGRFCLIFAFALFLPVQPSSRY